MDFLGAKQREGAPLPPTADLTHKRESDKKK
jgi:hypothetical protein